MSLDSIILQQIIEKKSTRNPDTPNTVKQQKTSIQQEEKQEVIETKIEESKQETLRKIPKDYKSFFKKRMIESYISQYTKGRATKKYLSVTESIECPLLTWFRLTGRIKREHIQIEKIFYLLNVYGIIGTAGHNFVYKMIPFQQKEKSLYDNEYLMGRYDFLHEGILCDIKTSRTKYDVTPQLGLLYYLANKNNVHIDELHVWWLLLDQVTVVDTSKAKEFYEKHVPEVVIPLYYAWKNDMFPEIKIDRRKLKCKDCIIENFCKSYDPKKDASKVSVESSTDMSQQKEKEVSENAHKENIRTNQEEVSHKKDILFLL